MKSYAVSRYKMLAGEKLLVDVLQLEDLETAMGAALTWARREDGSFADVVFYKAIHIGRIGADPIMTRAEQGSSDHTEPF